MAGRGRSPRQSNTQVRGRKLTVRQMTDEERVEYGLPLTGADAVRAEMESINEERMMDFGWGTEGEDVLDRESTPGQPELQIKQEGCGISDGDTWEPYFEQRVEEFIGGK